MGANEKVKHRLVDMKKTMPWLAKQLGIAPQLLFDILKHNRQSRYRSPIAKALGVKYGDIWDD